MNEWALVTGASGGIGEAFAKLFARDGINLVLAARSESKLVALKDDLEEQYGIQAEVIPVDLSKTSEAEKLVDYVRQKKLRLDYLINNAGVGAYGPLIESDWALQHDMIELNIVALTYLSQTIGQQMAEQGRGRIVNVASTAAFFPGPNMAVYYASKAYVLHLSEALNYELKPYIVSVTALCPGPTATGFAKAAKTEDSAFFSGHLPSAEQVAAFGYQAMQRGQAVAIHEARNRLLIWASRFVPRQQLVRSVGRLQQKKQSS